MPAAPAGPWGAILDRLETATRPRYRVMRLLGYGGMAGVYLADEPRLGRRVAIKVMAPGLMVDPALIDRFEQEARTTAQLNHPNIVTVYDVDERDGLHYFVMAFVAGRTLGQIMSEGTAPLPIAGVRHWLAQVGSALAYAHRAGVVHRDVKPGNVLVDADGNAHVTDFGIAKVGDAPSLTRTGFLVGTPAYMSPEQCVSAPVTGASDQYSLGVVAYEMLAGSPPFTGQTVAVLHAHVHEPPRPLADARPDCPPELAAAIERMLAKRPEDRFADVADAVTGAGAVLLTDRDPLRVELGRLAGALPPASVTPAPGRGRVTPPPAEETPPSLELVPGRGQLRTGDKLFLETRGGEISAERLLWSSSDPNIARVADDGSLFALNPGVVTITASTGEHSAAATFEIEPAPAAPVSAPDSETPVPVSDTDDELAATIPEATVDVTPVPTAATRPSAARTALPVRRYLPYAAAATIVVAVAAAIAVRGGGDGQADAPSTDEPVPTVGVPVVTPDPQAGQPAETPDPTAIAAADTAEDAPEPPATTRATDGPPASSNPPTATPPATPRPTSRDGSIRVAGYLPPSTQVVVTAADGTSRRVSGGSITLAPGRYTLEARAPGFQPASRQITVRPGATETWSPELVAVPEDRPADPQPAAPPPAAAADDAETQVQSVVAAFVRALGSRDLDAVARDYPGAGGAWGNQWKPFFENTRDVRDLATRLVRVAGTSIDGDVASTRFVVELSYDDLYNRRQQQTFQFEATLRRAGAGWSLVELRQIQ